MKTWQKGVILVAVPMGLQLAFTSLLVVLLNRAEFEAMQEIHSKVVLSIVQRVGSQLSRLPSELALFTVSKNSNYLHGVNDDLSTIPDSIRALKALVIDDAAKSKIVEQIEKTSQQLISRVIDTKKLVTDDRSDEALRSFKEGVYVDLLRQLNEELKEFRVEDARARKGKTDVLYKVREELKLAVFAGVALSILTGVLLSVFFSKGITNRLAVLSDNSVRLAYGDALNPVLKGNDELTDLDRVFHDMANQLAESTRKQRAVIENAMDVICSVYQDGKFAAVNPAAVKVWGYNPDELLGKNVTEPVFSDDITDTLNTIKDIMVGKSAMTFENRVQRKDGTIVNMLWSAHWSERERSLFCVAHDITERKQYEEQLKCSEIRTRTVIERMPLGVITIREDGMIDSVNPKMEQLFGCQSSELIGIAISNLFETADDNAGQEVDLLVERALERSARVNALRRDGSMFPAEIAFTKYVTDEGLRYLSIIQDVTEQHEIARIKREFVAMITHDLRTPLTSIRASLQGALARGEGELSPSVGKLVSIAERNSNRLLKLVNELLELERLEAGKLDILPEAVSIAGLVEQSVDAVRGFALDNSVSLQSDVCDGNVVADSDRLVQVLVNLLSNAVKFSASNSTVTVTVRRIERAVEFRVADQGRGIPLALQSAIFDKYKQVERQDATSKGGTGLGLPICKAIIEQHGGHIGLESEEGKGSTFWFRIPA